MSWILTIQKTTTTISMASQLSGLHWVDFLIAALTYIIEYN